MSENYLSDLVEEQHSLANNSESLDSTVSSANTLSALQETLMNASDVDQVTMEMFKIPLSSIYSKLNLKVSDAVVSTEQFNSVHTSKQAVGLAIESIGETLKKVWEEIIKKLKEMISRFKEYFKRVYADASAKRYSDAIADGQKWANDMRDRLGVSYKKPFSCSAITPFLVDGSFPSFASVTAGLAIETELVKNLSKFIDIYSDYLESIADIGHQIVASVKKGEMDDAYIDDLEANSRTLGQKTRGIFKKNPNTDTYSASKPGYRGYTLIYNDSTEADVSGVKVHKPSIEFIKVMNPTAVTDIESPHYDQIIEFYKTLKEFVYLNIDIQEEYGDKVLKTIDKVFTELNEIKDLVRSDSNNIDITTRTTLTEFRETAYAAISGNSRTFSAMFSSINECCRAAISIDESMQAYFKTV